MRILHISDLHLDGENESDCKLLVEAMLRDAEEHSKERPFDLIVFSGDLAGAGKSEEFELARDRLLEPLLRRLGLSKDRLVMCPGNHDVDRSEIRQMVELGLAQGLSDAEALDRLIADGPELAEAMARLTPWGSFVESLGVTAVGDTDGPLTKTLRIEIGGRTIGIVALNSAWRSSGGTDRGNLLVGGDQAVVALREISGCDVRIVVIHHPLDWLASYEADSLRVELESQGAIVLSGHEHSSDPSARTSPRGTAIYLQAGCLYSHLSYPNSYFIIDIDPDDRTVTVKVRRWSEKTRRFDAGTDTAVGGEMLFELPGGQDFTDLGHPRFSTVKRMIANAAAELRVLPDDLNADGSPPTSVEDILIEPRLLSVPFKEAQAMATINDGVGKHELDAVEAWIEANVILLSGDAQSGVSSSLYWLLSEGYERDATKMPAYLRLVDSRIGTAKESATLSKAASMFGHRSEDSRDPDLALAVDDLDPEAGKRFDRLLSFISANPRHRFLLGCSADDVAAISARLQGAGIEHVKAHLAPFGRSQLRALASTVSRGREADIDQIYGLIRTQSLPQTPFTMLALIAVMNVELSDPDDINQSSLLEAFVNLLLGVGELAEAEKLGMNYRKRVALLAELARTLYEKPGQIMPLPEVEAMFVEFFRARALRISASGVLGSLISRHVLASDGESVGFRHPALLQLFMGKWILEDEANKTEMLTDPLANAEAITHAVALDRSDRDLLDRVGRFARGVIQDVAEKLPRSEVDKALERFDGVDTWQGDLLDQTLEKMPERRSHQELDEELDRWSEALDVGLEKLERPALSTARELEATTMLLSDVLRNSDLVEDPGMKRELYELAVEGWILLIGLVVAEDHGVAPLREMMEDILEELMKDEDADIKEVMSQVMLLVMTVVIAIVAQGKLGSKSLSATIDACLDNPDFTESVTGTCLSVWIEAALVLPEWPSRLDDLLERLASDTYLRNATVAIAVAHYRTTDEERAAERLLAVLARRLSTSKDERTRRAEEMKIKESLGRSRRAYQGGLINGSPVAPALPVGED